MNSTNRRAWSRFLGLTRPFFASESRWRAFAVLALLLGLILAMNGLNVVNSYVGRYFMSAIEKRDTATYVREAVLYVCVFAASTVVAIFSTYTQDRFALWWREWLSRWFLDDYLGELAYVHLKEQRGIDNPDQRISEDIKTFTATTLSFLVMVVNATITTVAFAGILWSITPWLLLVAVGYAVFGSLGTILLGHRLVGLNNLQLKKEADFRYQLVHTRESAESIASLHGEEQEKGRLRDRLAVLVENFKEIIRVSRNLGFFTSGYDYLIPFLPVLIVAPRFLRGEVEFGVVTQAAMAFAQILGALSLIVVQFQAISTYAAVLNRLGTLDEAIADTRQPAEQPIQVAEDPQRVGYDHVTLHSPTGRELVKDLSLDVPSGRRLLVSGAGGIARCALLRAAAGLWRAGRGRILCPGRRDVVRLPPRPYLVPGSLREQLTYGAADPVGDDRLRAVLDAVGLGMLVERLGGLDVECDWANVLPADEQELLAVARLLVVNPRVALLDHALGAVGPARAEQVYRVLARTSMTYVSLVDDPALRQYHDLVLELQSDGGWRVHPVHDGAGP